MVYDPILDSEVDAESPITESLMTRLRDNPDAVAAGAASVPALKKILFPEATRTTNVDVTARAAPDGTGGVRWIGGGFEGNGSDGVVSAWVAGVYHGADSIISTPQTPTGMVVHYDDGDVVISGSITSAYRIVIKAAGNVTISGAITCRGLEIRCGGTLTISQNIVANNGVIPSIEDDEYASIGVARFYVGGDLIASQLINAIDILAFVLGDATISSTWSAVWLGTGAVIASGSAAIGFPTFDGSGQNNAATWSGVGAGGDGGGGGGGTGGGYGGRVDGFPGARAPGDGFRGGHRLYSLTTKELRRGGGGGSSSDNTGSDAGGRISLYVEGDLTATSAVLRAVGQPGATSGSEDTGGGGGGTVRVVCKGNIEDGTFNSSGGEPGLADGGGGGGGGTLIAATGYSGTQSYLSTGGTSSQGESGQGGTTINDTLTAAQVDDMVLAGCFDV